MNLLISPNAFKGTISAREAGQLMRDFYTLHLPDIQTRLIPVADGGDGTCELLTEALQLERIHTWSLDPYGSPVPGMVGWDMFRKKAFIDVSTASGIGLLGSREKSPDLASSYGTGMLIKSALDKGAEEIVLGLGGSATVDVGVGILAALGVVFLDDKGRELTVFSPDYLNRIRHVQLSPAIPKVRFTCLCDVKNRLFGDAGAVRVFGPQKGIREEEFGKFEQACSAALEKLNRKSKRVFVDEEGYGAAGGIAAGLASVFPTAINFGSVYFFDAVKIEESVKWADWILTGEGKYDAQSAEGKACYELLLLAKKHGRKTVLISSGSEAQEAGFDHLLQLDPLDFTSRNLGETARMNLGKVLSKSLEPGFWSL